MADGPQNPGAARCPKCGGAMVDGHIVDRGDSNLLMPAGWIPGEPRRGFFGNLKVAKRPVFQITALRCESCGYRETYARTRLTDR